MFTAYTVGLDSVRYSDYFPNNDEEGTVNAFWGNRSWATLTRLAVWRALPLHPHLSHARPQGLKKGPWHTRSKHPLPSIGPRSSGDFALSEQLATILATVGYLATLYTSFDRAIVAAAQHPLRPWLALRPTGRSRWQFSDGFAFAFRL